MPKSHFIKIERPSKINFIKDFFKKSLYELLLFIAIISSILYNFFFWRIQYINLIIIFFMIMNGVILLLIIEHFFYYNTLKETHYHYNGYLLIIALFFLNINFYMMMYKSIYSKIELIDFISFTVNCTIGIGFLTFLFAKTFYFNYKYGRELILESHIKKRKPFTIKLAFLSSLLSVLGIIILFSMIIFQNNIKYISNLYYGKTVEVEKLVWDMSELAFVIGCILALVNVIIFAEYYGCKKGWERNLFPLTPFDKRCGRKEFYTLIAILVVSIIVVVAIAVL